jgi:hypothetical protein
MPGKAIRPQPAEGVVNLKAFSVRRPQEAVVRGPRHAVALILVDHRVERPLDGLGLGLRPQDFLGLLELSLIEDQVFVAPSASCFVHTLHMMYILSSCMYIHKTSGRGDIPGRCLERADEGSRNNLDYILCESGVESEQ